MGKPGLIVLAESGLIIPKLQDYVIWRPPGVGNQWRPEGLFYLKGFSRLIYIRIGGRIEEYAGVRRTLRSLE